MGKINILLILISLFNPFQLLASEIFQLEKNANIGQMASQSYEQLCDVAQSTKAYLNKGSDYDTAVIHPGVASLIGADLQRVKDTLAFICQTVTQDTQAGRHSRLQDSRFIQKHFEFIRWLPNKQQSSRFEHNKPLLKNIPDDKILLTKYYIKKAIGGINQTKQTPHALYAIPHDERQLTLEQADAKSADITRYRYTKQQVLTGILDKKNLASPLVWLSRSDLEDTLLQGTVMIENLGDKQFYNVHRNNGIGYNRTLKQPQQQRYWYFKQTPNVLGYGKDANHKIAIHPLVTVAGDLEHLGLGKLILLTHQGQSRLSVLADTGGAFANNQYQLDYLGGYFSGWQDYIDSYRDFPDYFEARILLLRTNHE